MKKLILLGSLAFFLFGTACFGQSSSATNNSTGATQFLGFNGIGGGGPKILELRNNYNLPINMFTNASHRIKINANLTTTVNGVNKQFNGFVGISPNGYFNTNTPWSMLHLDGSNNTSFPGGGWRQWMNTGTFMRENSDGMYVGLKQEGTNRSDAIINWSDDPSGSAGPDKLRFIHTGGNLGNGNGQTDPRDPFALNGYEYMRMTAQGPNNSLNYRSGWIGIGPMFNDLNTPKSRLHINAEDSLTTYLQITLHRRTGSNNNDGLRIGILGEHPGLTTDPVLTPLLKDGNALMYNQEDRHIVFSTGFQTPSNIGTSKERVRITHIGAPTNLPITPLFAPNYYGVHNPASLPLNRTRVAISYDPLNAITRPMSLLHLGSNTDFQTATTSYDGWRNWMDIGMFISRPYDHMYFGLKQEFLLDRYDAVIGWGNESDSSFNGPDILRFIFTKTPSLTSTEQSTLGDGLECMRIYPGRDTTSINLFPNYTTWGRVGIGDFSINGLGGGPTHKLDVDGNGRFRLLPDSLYLADSTVFKYVMVDSLGVLRWSEVAPGGNNIGHYCGDTINTNPLTDDYEIPLNNFNYRFTGAGLPNTNSVSVGMPCGTPLLTKFGVYQNAGVTTNVNTFATGSLNQDIAAVPFLIYRGIYGEANGVQTISKVTNIGGEFRASNADANIGVRVRNISTIPNPSASATGGDFLCNGPIGFNAGITAQGSNSSGNNVGVQGLGFSINSSNQNMGGYFNAFGGTVNYGIYATVNSNDTIPSTLPPTSGSYAGYFNGSVIRTGNDNFSSDANLKTNIDSLQNALSIIDQLNPSSFYYDTTNAYGIAFSSEKQYGFIAQDVEQILPELVGTATHPASYDTLGNVIIQSYTYKTLQYNSFIGILTKGIQELKSDNDVLNDKLNSLDSINNALQDQINTLYGMITACCNNNSNMPQNNSMQQNQNGNSLDVTLTDNIPSIVLDQNVPNPFAEQTTITYTLTDGVQKAQMLFYNIEGKLIQSVDLSNAAGQGQINVFANDLSTGVYTYSLVVDGQIKGTKRMVKQ
jgi:hypothetical protein